MMTLYGRGPFGQGHIEWSISDTDIVEYKKAADDALRYPVSYDEFEKNGVKTVVCHFINGDTQVAVCQPGDIYDVREGILTCINKHLGVKLSKVDSLIKKHDKKIAEAELAKKAEKEAKAAAERKKLKLHEKKIKRMAKEQMEIEAAKKKLSKSLQEG